MTEEQINNRIDEKVLHSTMEYRKQLSNFMGEVKEVQKTILEKLEQQDKNSAEWREKMEPVVNAFEKGMTIRDFFVSFSKLTIALGLLLGAVVAIKTFIYTHRL